QIVSVLGEDYITFAEAKGLAPGRIFFWYGMRNALLSQITALALSLGAVVSGAVLVEVIFNYPGLGSLLYVAIRGQDYFVIQGVVLMLIVALAVLLFLVGLIFPLLHPRVRRLAPPPRPRRPRPRPRRAAVAASMAASAGC